MKHGGEFMTKITEIIRDIHEAIKKNKRRLLDIADTEEEQKFLAKQGKQLEQICEKYAAQYGITLREEISKKEALPRIIRKEYGDEVENMATDKLDFFIKLEEKNLQQLELALDCSKKAKQRKEAEIRTLQAIRKKRKEEKTKE